jgi:hypothetical protein
MKTPTESRSASVHRLRLTPCNDLLVLKGLIVHLSPQWPTFAMKKTFDFPTHLSTCPGASENLQAIAEPVDSFLYSTCVVFHAGKPANRFFA